jgi:PhnB protein
MNLNPYLNFRSSAREALTFYQSVFGGEVLTNEFGEYPDMGVGGDDAHLLMHGQLTTPDGLVLMAADTPSSMEYAEPAGFAVSINGDDEGAMQRYWDALADGGSVTMPFETPPWGGRFGMLTDRFGIDWMVSLDV